MSVDSTVSPITLNDLKENLAEHKQPWVVDGVVQALDLAEALGSHVSSQPERILWMAGQLGSPEADTGWHVWQRPVSRQELMLRLAIIAEFPRLPENLVPLIQFYFRSSDPALYQQACFCAGRHLSSTPALSAYINEYSAERKISLTGTPQLNGSRSNRRVALVCAADASRKPEHRIPELSPSGTAANGSENNALDVRILLQALNYLCTHHADTRLFSEKSHEFLISFTGLAVPANRVLGRRCKELLLTLCREALTDAEVISIVSKLLSSWLEAFRSTDDTGLKMMWLDAMDELCRVLLETDAQLTDSLLNNIAEAFGPADADWVNMRLYAWAARLNHPKQLPAQSSLAAVQLPGYWNSLRAWHYAAGNTPAQNSAFRNSSTRLSELYEQLCNLTSNEKEWQKRSSSDQALIGFSLIDLTLNLPEPFHKNALRMLNHQESGATAHQLSPLEAVYLRLLNLQKEGPAYAEAGLIHSVEHTELLLRLLSIRSGGAPAFEIADALEHRLRVGISGQAAFDAGRFLYRILARKPGAAFTTYFTELVSSRTYTTHTGETIVVSDTLAQIKNQQPVPEGACSAFMAGLRAFRLETESQQIEGQSIIGSLELLAGLITPDHDESQISLADLLLTAPTEDTEATARLKQQMKLWHEELITRLGSLRPDSERKHKEARAAAVRIIALIHEMGAGLAPHLYAHDQRLTLRLSGHCEAQLHSYISVLDEVAKSLGGLQSEKRRIEAEQAEQLYDQLTGIPSGPVRHALAEYITLELSGRVSAGTLRVKFPATDLVLPDLWTEESQLLEMFCSPNILFKAGQNNMNPVLIRSWNRLTREAMEQGFESRVYAMVQPGPYETIYQDDACADTLSAVRNWYLDRYNAVKAQRVNKINNSRKETSLKHRSLQLNSFFGHYSAVWIAIFVGSILMLDFGDAWADMADQGDRLGIFITFAAALVAAYLYTSGDLRRRVRHAPGDDVWANRMSWLGRTALFVAACLAFSLLIAGCLWWILSGTDHVVQGEGAPLHIVVWASFALFIGLFFGLIAKVE